MLFLEGFTKLIKDVFSANLADKIIELAFLLSLPFSVSDEE